MHFATFAGSQHEARAPLLRLVKARDKFWGLEMERKGDWESEGTFRAVGVGEGDVLHRRRFPHLSLRKGKKCHEHFGGGA